MFFFTINSFILLKVLYSPGETITFNEATTFGVKDGKYPPPLTEKFVNSVCGVVPGTTRDNCIKKLLATDPRQLLTMMYPPTTNPAGPSYQKPSVTLDPDVPPTVSNNPPNDPPDPTPIPPPPSNTGCPTYHPNNSIPGKPSQVEIINGITQYVNNKGLRHDPDGITWLKPGDWKSWDGVTTMNPCTSTTAQLMAFIFPPPGGINTMLGLRDLFYQVKPFADNSNPTVAEIENWNIEVIRLFRRLLGFTQTTHPVSNHKCTFLRAAWAEERARTDYWTASYPGSMDGATGPCTIPFSSNEHCGASFIPNATDQAPYLCPSTMAPCTNTSSAEGISNHKTDIPWGIKMSRIIGQYLGTDGIGNHTGPFIGREYFGSAWYANGGTLTVRTKWSGNLAPTCP